MPVESFTVERRGLSILVSVETVGAIAFPCLSFRRDGVEFFKIDPAHRTDPKVNLRWQDHVPFHELRHWEKLAAEAGRKAQIIAASKKGN